MEIYTYELKPRSYTERGIGGGDWEATKDFS